jgi:homoserine O-acetyltransferase/O-succinyltransferase
MRDAVLNIDGFTTQSGATLDLRLAYRIRGELNAAKSNLIVYPTDYSGLADDNGYLLGPDKALDPTRYCIVIPNLFGNGVSSSPSNTMQPWARRDFHA